MPFLSAALAALCAGAPAARAADVVIDDELLLSTTDAADRGCRVVLRELQRVAPLCPSGQACGAFSGTIDVATDAVDAGLVPAVLVQTFGEAELHELPASGSGPSPIEGFTRFSFLVDDAAPEAPVDGPRLRAIPFLHTIPGGRLFDHNRRAGDLDVYEVDDAKPSIDNDDKVCTAPGPRAHVAFAESGAPRFHAPLGKELIVTAPLSRLTTCRGTHNGFPAWDLRVGARFAPSGVVDSASLRAFESPGGVPGGNGVAVPARLAIPEGTTSVELWLENSGIGCTAYDSLDGRNYKFSLAPPSWVGNAAGLLTRASGDACEGAPPLPAEITFSGWARVRAVRTQLCVEAWAPGLTDVDAATAAASLSAHARVRYGAHAPFVTTSAQYVGRVGNNARFMIDLRALDPFPRYACHLVDTTRHQQPDGALLVSTMEVALEVNGAVLHAPDGAPFRVRYEEADGSFFRRDDCLTTPR